MPEDSPGTSPPEEIAPPLTSAGVPLLALLVGLVAFGPLSTDLYLPALPEIGRDLSAGPAKVQLTLSVFLAGFAICMLIYGPLSDRFGRRPVLLGSLGVFLLASAGCALAQSIDQLVAARFLQALGACAGPVLGRAIVRDIYGPTAAARILSYLAMAMALAPAIGPILGGYLTVAFGWRANFVLLVGFGLVCLFGILRILPETNLLKDPMATRPGQLLANYVALTRHRRFLGYLLVCSMSYSGIFAFISGSPQVLITGLGLTPDQFGYCFAAVVIGFIIGSFLSGRLHAKVSADRLIGLGCAVAILGGGAGAALALAGVATVTSIVAPAAVYLIGGGLMMPNAMAGAIGPFPRMAGAASALVGFAQMGIAALVGVAVGQLQDGTPVAMASAIALVALCAGLALVVIILPAARADND